MNAPIPHPTLHVHFTSDHPKEAGIWLTMRRNSHVLALDVTHQDLEQDKHEPNWLAGYWAARLLIVSAPVVQLDKGSVRDWIDAAILDALRRERHQEAIAFQRFRLAFFGEELPIPDTL
jgi:hypothetical protein